MLDCLILGDSIAVGVGQARPACTTAAKVGITSGTYLQTVFATAPHQAASAVISLGVNDDASVDTIANLRQLRRSIRATRVTWLLPGLKDQVRAIIQQVARENGDRTLDTKSQAGPDHLHPTRDGYRLIASWTEQTTSPTYAAAAPTLRSTPFIPFRAAQPVLGAGSIYGTWPPTNLMFGALPPQTYAFRALGTTATR